MCILAFFKLSDKFFVAVVLRRKMLLCFFFVFFSLERSTELWHFVFKTRIQSLNFEQYTLNGPSFFF